LVIALLVVAHVVRVMLLEPWPDTCSFAFPLSRALLREFLARMEFPAPSLVEQAIRSSATFLHGIICISESTVFGCWLWSDRCETPEDAKFFVVLPLLWDRVDCVHLIVYFGAEEPVVAHRRDLGLMGPAIRIFYGRLMYRRTPEGSIAFGAGVLSARFLGFTAVVADRQLRSPA
jgi:hypothetical protein